MGKTKKIIKGILIGIAAFLIVAIAAVALGYHFVIKPKVVEPLKQLAQSEEGLDMSSFSQNTLLEQLEETLHDEDVREYINSQLPGQTEKLLGKINEAKNKQSNSAPESTGKQNSSAPETTQKPITADNTPESVIPQPGGINIPVTPNPQTMPANTAAPTPEHTLKAAKGSESKYDQLKDQVNANDLADAMSLAGKVDTGYIMGLLSGGLSVQEKKELKKYLMAHLSSGEISRGIELFAEYSYLLG